MNFRFFSSLGNRWCENEHRITVFVKCYTYFDYYIVDVVRFALEYKMRYACNVDIFVVFVLLSTTSQSRGLDGVFGFSSIYYAHSMMWIVKFYRLMDISHTNFLISA